MKLIKRLSEYGDFILKEDPACRTKLEAIFMYPIVKALVYHRIANYFYRRIVNSNATPMVRNQKVLL